MNLSAEDCAKVDAAVERLGAVAERMDAVPSGKTLASMSITALQQAIDKEDDKWLAAYEKTRRYPEYEDLRPSERRAAKEMLEIAERRSALLDHLNYRKSHGESFARKQARGDAAVERLGAVAERMDAGANLSKLTHESRSRAVEYLRRKGWVLQYGSNGHWHSDNGKGSSWATVGDDGTIKVSPGHPLQRGDSASEYKVERQNGPKPWAVRLKGSNTLLSAYATKEEADARAAKANRDAKAYEGSPEQAAFKIRMPVKDCAKLDAAVERLGRLAGRCDGDDRHERRIAAKRGLDAAKSEYATASRLTNTRSLSQAADRLAKAEREYNEATKPQPRPDTATATDRIADSIARTAAHMDAYEARRDAAPIDVARNQLRRLESQLGSGTPADQNKWRAEIKALKEKVRRLSASGGGPLSGSEKRGDATPTPAKKTSEYVGPKDAKGVEAVLNRRGAKNDDGGLASSWPSMSEDQRLALAMKAGWRTNEGKPSGIAKRFAKSKWTDITEGSRATLERFA